MATSPSFNWPEPDNTDLVKNGALAIRTAVDAIDTSMTDLLGGTTGQVLSKTSNTDMDFTWVTTDDANAIQNAIVNAKGDIIGASANDTPAITSVGANGTVLTADSTAATGLAYEGAWTNWTPNVTGLTIGNGTQIARYRKVGKFVTIFYYFKLGSTSAVGGINYVELPFGLAYNQNGNAYASIEDFGALYFEGIAEINGNNFILGVMRANQTYADGQRITSTVPMTWTTNDTWWTTFTYEAV
jgi:hypothetical protein